MKRNWMRVSGCLLVSCLLAGLMPVKAAAVTFQDVPSSHWAKHSIDRCVEQGFFQGQTATTFGLGQTMTRGAVTVVLDRFFSWEDVELSLPFEDVPAGAWYAGALRSAYAKGAVTGQSRQFRPGDPITREELAVMLIRALGYTGLAGVAQELPQTFTDVTSNPGYINMARDLGLLSGTKEDTFSPDRHATREQVAVILMRLYDKLQAEKPVSMGIVTTAAEVKGLDRVALSTGLLVTDGTVKPMLNEEAAAEILTAVEASGAEALAYVSATPNFLDKHAGTAVQNLRNLMEEEDYQGLVLEVENLQKKHRKKLGDFVRQLNAALEEQTLYLVISVPEADGKSVLYDYETLGRAADAFVLKMPRDVWAANGLAVAPTETPEAIYRGVMQLQESGIASERISVMLTTAGQRYDGARVKETLTWEKIEALLAEKQQGIASQDTAQTQAHQCPEAFGKLPVQQSSDTIHNAAQG